VLRECTIFCFVFISDSSLPLYNNCMDGMDESEIQRLCVLVFLFMVFLGHNFSIFVKIYSTTKYLFVKYFIIYFILFIIFTKFLRCSFA